LYYRLLKKLFPVLELGRYEGQIHLETGLIMRVHTRWSNKPRKDGGYWAVTDRQREGKVRETEGGGGARERGRGREREIFTSREAVTHFLFCFPSLLIFYLLAVILFVFI
jgi:hypothetical protein